jgi:hypothetical protein
MLLCEQQKKAAIIKPSRMVIFSGWHEGCKDSWIKPINMGQKLRAKSALKSLNKTM